jgi:hypothetical protein
LYAATRTFSARATQAAFWAMTYNGIEESSESVHDKAAQCVNLLGVGVQAESGEFLELAQALVKDQTPVRPVLRPAPLPSVSLAPCMTCWRC